MGADARWVCHTCKTVCCRGGRPRVRYGAKTDISSIHLLRKQLRVLSEYVDLDDVEKNIVAFLDDLHKWLSRHKGHNIHIGSDYTTDIVDLDDYHNESVDGKVSDATRLELRTRNWQDWRKTGINKIKDIIRECKSSGAYGMMIDVDKAATTLYDKFTEDMAIERGG